MPNYLIGSYLRFYSVQIRRRRPAGPGKCLNSRVMIALNIVRSLAYCKTSINGYRVCSSDVFYLLFIIINFPINSIIGLRELYSLINGAIGKKNVVRLIEQADRNMQRKG